ncbi:MAG: cell division protein ZapA [Rikenellaceae bacterium]|nr:cell division protein ZapA [Rikenellaceae bacterium]
MEQNITIKIAGKDYALKVTSPEMEQLMRIAAETINEKLMDYDSKYPEKTLADKLALISLTVTVSKLSYYRKLKSVNEEAKRMLDQTNSYLKNNE